MEITGGSSGWNCSSEDSFFGGQIHLDGWIATRIVDLASENLLDGHDEVDKSTYLAKVKENSNGPVGDLQMNLAADKMAFAIKASSYYMKIENLFFRQIKVCQA